MHDTLDDGLNELLAPIIERLVAVEQALARAGIATWLPDDNPRLAGDTPARTSRRSREPSAPPIYGPPQKDDHRLTKSQTAKRYAVTTRSIERWAKSPELHFPPHDVIGDRWFFWLSHLQIWTIWRASQPNRGPKAACATSCDGRGK